ncbi:hypothetical protein E3A20_00230 [Planctomyces bekefii]|uniref:Methyltransferase type 11 domain-containing protein n=1 Tax=Planctomyces bekefii TaxID=1653850 RepID=A0A5C6MDL2_9PLAN|nr:hypothetical protein E3A20_00230 [Planctomyces bekefii]
MIAGLMALVMALVVDGAEPAGGFPAISFVGTFIALKLALFAYWPMISKKRHEAFDLLREVFESETTPEDIVAEENELRAQNARASRLDSRAAGDSSGSLGLKLWDERDSRVDLSLFYGTVPTFVLSVDQRFLDWNPGFQLIFGALEGVRRGGHVSHWFNHLDNFRRVPKRSEALYGESILPIADRERVTHISPQFGRMVFVKIMTPIIDRKTGRIIGWTVALNINSVNLRHEFFEALFRATSEEGRRIRYASAVDGLFEDFADRRQLLEAHREQVSDAIRVLDIGARTGSFTKLLLNSGHKVTAVEEDVHLLRVLRGKCEGYESRFRVVRQELSALKNLPVGRYDAVTVVDSIDFVGELSEFLTKVHGCLRAGGVLSLSLRVGDGESIFASLRSDLESNGKFEALKHQFTHVKDHDLLQRSGVERLDPHHVVETLQSIGFVIETDWRSFEQGNFLLLKARK